MFRLYKKYLKKNIHWVIIGPIFKLLEAIFELLVPLVIKNMIDIGINGDGGKSYLIKQGVLLLIFAATGLCSTLVCQFIASEYHNGLEQMLETIILSILILYRLRNLIIFQHLVLLQDRQMIFLMLKNQLQCLFD